MGRRHLRRPESVYQSGPLIYFVTACTRERIRVLARPRVAGVLRDALQVAGNQWGWLVGRYVVMPDHVHMFVTPGPPEGKSLSDFMREWKKWTSRRIASVFDVHRVWQREFFDHLLRTDESYDQKWEYVRSNPVRAGLCVSPDEWPYQGEIHILQL